MNTLECFHVTENVGVDKIHDVFAPLEVRPLLLLFIYEEKLLCLEQLNERIVTYPLRLPLNQLQHRCGISCKICPLF